MNVLTLMLFFVHFFLFFPNKPYFKFIGKAMLFNYVVDFIV